MATLVHAVDHPELLPFAMPDRFRHEVTYFMTPPGQHGVPVLPAREYWIRLADARGYAEEGVIRIVSPLDSASRAELELSEEQEAWLEWMINNAIEHIRIEYGSV